MMSSRRFLQKQNVRIFIGDFYSAVARKVFCAVSSIYLFISGNVRNICKTVCNLLAIITSANV